MTMPERGERFSPPEANLENEFKTNPLAETEEFKFHQDRYKKQSDLHNDRGILKRVGGMVLGTSPKNLSEIDMAHEEALRENADLEKRKDLEFREWQKHLKVVIDHLKTKRDDPEGEGKSYRPLLLILGGGMRGPYSAAQALALNEMGLDASKFDTVVGISAGAGTGSYYLAGSKDKTQTYKGTAIFYDECTSRDFINLSRLHHIMDVTTIGKAMRQGDKALDQQAILDSPANFYVAVTRQDNKHAELIDVKTARPGMISAVEASMNVPLLTAPGIEVNDNRYIDGGFDPLPLQQVIEKFNPTDILVLPQVPFNRLETFKSSSGMDFIAEHIPAAGSPGTIRKFLKITKELRTLLESFKQQKNVNIGILWPPEQGLSNNSAEHDKVKAAVYETMRDTFRQFGEPEPKNIELYESSK